MSIRSMRGAGTITSLAVISAMRRTRSSITRASALMTSLSSASARVAISSSLESGPGWMNSMRRCRNVRLSSRSEGRAGWGSDTVSVCRTCGGCQASKDSGCPRHSPLACRGPALIPWHEFARRSPAAAGCRFLSCRLPGGAGAMRDGDRRPLYTGSTAGGPDRSRAGVGEAGAGGIAAGVGDGGDAAGGGGGGAGGGEDIKIARWPRHGLAGRQVPMSAKRLHAPGGVPLRAACIPARNARNWRAWRLSW